MAKRKKSSLPKDSFLPNIDITAPVDPLADQIKHFKDLGWDNNRIAARLGIHKHIVEKY
jgi:hypothetical protein